MKWNIVTDSSCDLFPAVLQNGEVKISSVPFIISVGDRDFLDDETLDTAEMLEAMEHYERATLPVRLPRVGWSSLKRRISALPLRFLPSFQAA